MIRMLRPTLIVVSILIGLSAQSAADDYSLRLDADGEVTSFFDWAGPTLPLYYFVPKGKASTAPIVFVMHGNSRDADRYFAEMKPFAERLGFVLLVPEFSRPDFSLIGYNLGNVFDKAGLRNPEEIWAYSAIDAIFAAAKSTLSSERTGYRIYGHSAGAQFVHRLLYFKPAAAVERAVIANAGYYTMPNMNAEFPYGLKGSGVALGDIKPIFARDTVVLLGDADIDPNDPTLRKKPEAMAQGPHRFARGHAFYAAMKSAAAGSRFCWSLETVKGVGHDSGKMAIAAATILARD